MLVIKDLDSNLTLKAILESLLKDYSSHIYSCRIFTIRVAYSIYEYILLIPKMISRFIVKLFKEKRNKDELGYRSFIDLSITKIRKHYNKYFSLLESKRCRR